MQSRLDSSGIARSLDPPITRVSRLSRVWPGLVAEATAGSLTVKRGG
jgi:hypothetical protein